MDTATNPAPIAKKAKAPRLTLMEKRAKAFAESIKYYGSTSFSVEWTKSATWGMCARVLHHGAKVSHAGGCGYCKHSAALAEALRFLAPDDDGHMIARTGGAGVSSVIAACAKAGWKLECTYSGKWEDAYQISKA